MFSNKKIDGVTNEVRHFKVSDAEGEYDLSRETGIDIKGKNAYVKSEVGDLNAGGKIIKISVSLSRIEKFKLKDREINVLRPKISQYSQNRDGVESVSQILLDYEKKKIKFSHRDGKTKKTEKQSFDMMANAKSNSIFCFYSQIEECIKVTGFLNLTREKKAGAMNFNMIFDADPFLADLSKEKVNTISYSASFEYEKQDDDGGARYVMKFGDYEIDYKFDKDNQMVKKNWIAQGLSIEEK
jgi:hypothetical protein